jgi:hypothetical protein
VPDDKNHNWVETVRRRMAGALPPSAREDVIAELAAHLEEAYNEARRRGLSEPGAFHMALNHVTDWDTLANDICRAKSREDSMNQRTKALWLPGIVILFAAGLLLMLLDRAPVLQQLLFLGCMGLLVCAAISEAARMSQSSRSLLLPGFVSLVAAGLFLIVIGFVCDPSYFFSGISLQPHNLVLPNYAPGRVFYCAWLLAHVLFGGLGAYLSRRAGGTRIARMLAGAFPAILMFGLLGLVVPISAVFFEHNAFVLGHPGRLAVGILVWAVAPVIPVVVGTAPFLRESTPQQA